MTLLIVSSPIAVRQMGHHLDHQQIRPIHHVPGAAAAERPDQILEHVDMQLHRLLGGDAGLGQQAGQRVHFAGQVADAHHHVGPQQLAIMVHQPLREVAPGGCRGGQRAHQALRRGVGIGQFVRRRSGDRLGWGQRACAVAETLELGD